MAPRSPISHISDTARWVAVYRAMESERSDALFRDPWARELAGVEGEDIVSALPKGRQLAWPMIVRTAVMDEIIRRAVDRDGTDTVLNLAAGLDTRPYRLPLPSSLRWIDVDLPDILAYRQERLHGARPRCTLEVTPLDLTDEAERKELFARAGSGSSRTLVVTEGLLVYLTRDQVAALARDLHAQPSFREWLIDIASPRLLEMLRKSWGRNLEAGRAPLIFGPAEGTAFFEPCGWREVEFRSMFAESIRLKRTMRFGRFWNLLGKLYPKKKQEEFRRMSGVVLLGRLHTEGPSAGAAATQS